LDSEVLRNARQLLASIVGKNRPNGTIFPNEPLGYADSCETIVAFARRSPNSRLGRIPIRSKLLWEQRPSRAVR